MSRQDPFPGIGGTVRIGRRAAVSSKTVTTPRPGTLPLGWKTVVPESHVLIHVSIPGEPHPKMRPRSTKAKIAEGTGALIQGHTYNPKENENAEELLRYVFNTTRVYPRPTPGPVGVLLFFRTRGGRADADNLAKTVLDAMNGTVIDDDQQVAELHVHLLRTCTDPGTDVLAWSTSRRVPGG